jgi:hypothetical protein
VASLTAHAMQITCSPLDPNYLIAQRDKFVCQFCASHRMHDENEALDVRSLVVIDIIPKKLGGSDNLLNKVTACRQCAELKGERIFFPNVDYSSRDRDGWHLWKGKVFGKWSMQIRPDGEECCIVNKWYWFPISRAFEDWPRHMSEKCWCGQCSRFPKCPEVDIGGLLDALDVARRLLKPPNKVASGK